MSSPSVPSHPGERVRPRGLWRIAWLLVIGACIAAGISLSDASDEVDSIDRRLLVTIRRSDLEVVIVETGRVQPRLQTDIKAKVGGQVEAVMAGEGELVRKGQVLLQIEDSDHRREVARMRAAVAEQRSLLAHAMTERRRSTLAWRRGVAPVAELDRARHEVQLARSRWQGARVTLATAVARLQETRVTAPFEGTIVEQYVQPGEVVVPGVSTTVEGKPLLILADLSQLRVRVQLNQIDVVNVRRGQSVQLSVEGLEGRSYRGTVDRVASAAASNTPDEGTTPRLFPVEVVIDPTQDLSAMKSGMVAELRILVEKRPATLAVPIEAIFKERGRSFVQLMSAGTSVRREVRTGMRNDREVELLAGLREGDQVLLQQSGRSEVKL